MPRATVPEIRADVLRAMGDASDVAPQHPQSAKHGLGARMRAPVLRAGGA